MSMRIFFIWVASSMVSMLLVQPTQADERKADETAKHVGQKTGEAVHEVAEAGKEVGQKVVEVARETGHVVRDGAKEFHKAVKGEGSKGKKKSLHTSGTTRSSSSSSKSN